ncbi:tRNA (guanine(37)-N1)-methyltransferase 1 [Vitis vinifera]|uniref:tRNA (Guanine(37)-N1)-methyltransferase 1 n=1 Tax=Vitis vinifera TaxID=29760 RepID=A0A438FDC6_VITVI|nr:tRNA (guanine(37)-N1)-methyltransferase 1 [Vitis vinifera]
MPIKSLSWHNGRGCDVSILHAFDKGSIYSLKAILFSGVDPKAHTHVETCRYTGMQHDMDGVALSPLAVLKEDTGQSMTSAFELVKCKLTLFYNYWQMNEILEALLPEGMIVPSAFEMVGHIAHLNLRDEHLPYKKLIAKVVLDKNKPKIQTVVNKTDAIHNDYRTMQLEVLAGNRSLVTTVIENGMRFQVDLATVYVLPLLQVSGDFN